MGDCAASEPGGHPGGLIGRFRSEAMVDRQRADLATAPSGPTIGQETESKTVGAAGNGNRQARWGFERPQRSHGGGKDVISDR